MKTVSSLLFITMASISIRAGEISPDQVEWIEGKFKRNGEKAMEALRNLPLNTDSEPDLGTGFKPLCNGKDLSGWKVLGGAHSFEVAEGMIVGKCVPGQPNAFLSTEKNYRNFILTLEMKWEVESNTGIMVRAQTRKKRDETVVYGTQVEMEGPSQSRGWSGGIYGEKAGGWKYPLVLEAHKAIRNAVKADDWNRVTVMVQGDTYKTWINGVAGANYTTNEYPEGFIGLQIHSGKSGTVLFRGIKIKEL
ncbi:DUF1080 domain-containing protein [Akkermansiaceae bacterium]|nr:DUF1080 domain-containing protein [Akkermansiaceae bacterium]